VMRLAPGLGVGGRGAAAPVACLTGFAAELAFDCSHDCFDIPLIKPLYKQVIR
jgi:hypothetical protein